MQQQPHKGVNTNGEREGGLLELRARAPHGPLHHSLAPCLCLLLPLPAPELPLPLQLLMVSLLSSQPLSWGLGLEEQGQGVTLACQEAVLKHLKILNSSLRIQFGKSSENNNGFYCIPPGGIHPSSHHMWDGQSLMQIHRYCLFYESCNSETLHVLQPGQNPSLGSVALFIHHSQWISGNCHT